MFDADVVSQRVSPGLTNGETTLGCRRHELKFDPFATLFKASKPPGGPFKPSFGLSGAVLWPHTHFPRGRVARSFGDVCFPFRNCGCPALAFFASAGTMLPINGLCHTRRFASHLRRSSPALYHLFLTGGPAIESRSTTPQGAPFLALSAGAGIPDLNSKRSFCRPRERTRTNSHFGRNLVKGVLNHILCKLHILREI
jgi:hypothetical protein